MDRKFAEDQIEWAERFVTEGARQVGEQVRLLSSLEAGNRVFDIETRVLRTLEAMQASNVAFRNEMKLI